MPTETGVGRGLRQADAAARLAEVGRNELPRPSRPSLGARLLDQLREPMALLLVAAALISGVVLGERIDAIAIVAIVVVNAAIALVQEGRAERALEALEQLEAPAATVVRDGRRRSVPAAELVPGDWVVVQAGDRVPADVELVVGDALEVDEAILTGESLPAAKHPGGATGADVSMGDRDGLLHSGTFVTRGSGEGHVTATGPDAALGAIARQLGDIRQEPTPLQRQLAGLTRRLGIAAVAVAGSTFALLVLVNTATGVEDAFLVAVALAVAAVPEGLAAVTSVALALGVRRMARRGAIVRRLPAVETLGAVDVLVVDKTGTLTENRMEVAAVIGADGATHQPHEVPDGLRVAIEPVALLCNDATTDPPTGDPTERALLTLAADPDPVALRDQHPRLALAPFTSERKRMGSVHDLDGTPTLLVKGAPEPVLDRCTRLHVDGTQRRASAADLDLLLERADEHAQRGERLLALATRRLDTVPADAAEAERDLTLVALVALRDPPRDSASESVRVAGAAGITLLMATGDHPATASAIAGEVGITGDTTTGSHLRADGPPQDPTRTRVYARVDPDQKLELVTRLQTGGHTVAMTGDGVNDAPALRRADIGVALGATGSDVAREAADLVITDDDLATIVAAVHEGRGIYDNLRKVVDYLVSSNLAEVTVVVTTLLLLPAFGVPLLPLQLLWINLLTDGLPALALGVDPVADDLMQQQPRSATVKLLGLRHLRRLASRAVVLAAGALAALVLADRVLALDPDESRTVLFSSLVLSQVLFAYVISSRWFVHGSNRWLHVAAATALALHALILVVPAAQVVFDTVTPSGAGLALIALGGLVPPGLLALGRVVGPVGQ